MRTTPADLLSVALRFGIELYRNTLSHSMLHSCRFLPSCSEYAVQALERHGPIRGVQMAIARLSRCHPGSRAGVDPVT